MRKLRLNTKKLLSLSLLTWLVASLVTPAHAAGFDQTDIFNPKKILSYDLTIPDASVTALNNPATARTYTAASLAVSTGGFTLPAEVGIKLKGTTSFELLNQSPSFKVQFNWGPSKGQRFLGLKDLTLNAMTQDNSHLHEFASYKLFNSMNVPAPKTGWARLRVNGMDRGLYVVIEAYDDIMMATHFKDQTQHLYEGVALQDFKPGNNDGGKKTGHFLEKMGWKATPNKNDLGQFIDVANDPSLKNWWKRLATVTDRSEMVRFFAVENFTGQWDGYSGPIINNYFLRSNVNGKFAFMPWGTDQTFGENRQTAQYGDSYFFPLDTPQAGFPWVQQAFHTDLLDRGMLFRKCLAFSICKHEYLINLKATAAKAKSIKLGAAMIAAAKVQAAYNTADVQTEQARTASWLDTQYSRVSALLKANNIK